MSNTTCPKCGAPLAGRIDGANMLGAKMVCGDKGPECYSSLTLMEALTQLAAMTARAEKAEAEVRMLREAVMVRDRLRWKFPAGIQKCSYCDMDTTACAHTCPTVTHPVEVPHD